MLRCVLGVALAAAGLAGCWIHGTQCGSPIEGDWVTVDDNGLYIFCECDARDTGGADSGTRVTRCDAADTAPPTCERLYQFGTVDLSTSPLTLSNTYESNPYSYTLTDDELSALRDACGYGD